MFEFVALLIQLCAIRSYRLAVEINFSAVGRFRAGIRTYWITFELHNGTRVIYVGASVNGVSVWIRSRRTAYTECNNAQADSREYEYGCEYFFHGFLYL
jgi:hypothetical protein